MMHSTFTVYCDAGHPGCDEHGSTAVGSRTARNARDEARKAGFVRRRIDGQMADLCPVCASIVAALAAPRAKETP